MTVKNDRLGLLFSETEVGGFPCAPCHHSLLSKLFRLSMKFWWPNFVGLACTLIVKLIAVGG